MKFFGKGSFWYGVSLLIIPVVIVAASFGFSEKARFVPLMVGIVTTLLGILVLVNEAFPRVAEFFDVDLIPTGANKPKADADPKKGANPSSSSRLWIGFGLVIGFFILIYLVGFNWATPLFVLAFLKTVAREKWMKALMIAIGMWAFVYFVFDYGMKMDLFQGVLRGGLAPPFF